MSQCKCDYISYVKIPIMLGQLSHFTVSKAMTEKKCVKWLIFYSEILCVWDYYVKNRYIACVNTHPKPFPVINLSTLYLSLD